jgi:hypothetical protein
MTTSLSTYTPTLPPAISQDGEFTERFIAWNLIAFLAANGWRVASVYDGEEHVTTPTAQDAMEAIFAVSEIVWLLFCKEGAKAHRVMLVPGNREDLISDWHYSDGDADGFNACMEAIAFNIESLLNNRCGAKVEGGAA